MLKVMIAVVDADFAEAEVPALAPGTTVVICHSDPERARSVARQVVGYRTVVFVGDISQPDGRAAAEELGEEISLSRRSGPSLAP